MCAPACVLLSALQWLVYKLQHMLTAAAAAGITGLLQEGTPLSLAVQKPMLSAQLRMSEVSGWHKPAVDVSMLFSVNDN